jgi:hypothetical protein
MPRKEHIHHYIYRVTCLISRKYYIGMHSTSNLEDGYFGSGKILKRSLNKYRKFNHVVEILEWLPDRSSLKLREKEIVNENLLKDEMCMNLQLGGAGGFSSEEHQKKAQESSRKSYIHRLKNDKDFFKKISDSKIANNLGNQYAIGNKSFSGKTHSEETKRKIGESNSVKQKGSNNSQYGKCWITNEIESKKINKGDIILEGWRLGRKIKKE